jgi:hypothetical protein
MVHSVAQLVVAHAERLSVSLTQVGVGEHVSTQHVEPRPHAQ